MGDRVAVVGGGVVGCLAAWVASRVPATEVLLVDVNRARAATAAALGLDFALADALPPNAGDRDVVIHASGSGAGAAAALALAGDEALVVEASWHGDRPVTLPLGEAFHARRLTLRSSQVGALPVEKRPRWTFARRLGVALKLCADPALDCLVEPGDLAFGDLPEALPNVLGAAAGASGLCYRVVYPA